MAGEEEEKYLQAGEKGVTRDWKEPKKDFLDPRLGNFLKFRLPRRAAALIALMLKSQPEKGKEDPNLGRRILEPLSKLESEPPVISKRTLTFREIFGIPSRGTPETRAGWRAPPKK